MKAATGNMQINSCGCVPVKFYLQQEAAGQICSDPLCRQKEVASYIIWGFPGGYVVENPPATTGAAGDSGLIPGSGRSPREGNGNPFQYSCW